MTSDCNLKGGAGQVPSPLLATCNSGCHLLWPLSTIMADSWEFCCIFSREETTVNPEANPGTPFDLISQVPFMLCDAIYWSTVCFQQSFIFRHFWSLAFLHPEFCGLNQVKSNLFTLLSHIFRTMWKKDKVQHRIAIKLRNYNTLHRKT